MRQTIQLIYLVILVVISMNLNGQSSEIVTLDEKNSYQYKSYYKDGSLKSVIDFYAKKPYSSVETFELKLEAYKIKYHGESKEFYENGQLKEIVVYERGKVIQFMKQYFEDGEELSVHTESLPEFQFIIEKQNIWLNNKIKETEEKYKIDLEGQGVILLEISKDGTIKTVKAKTAIESHRKYLIEIGEQIKVTKPAMKNGEPIGTRFAFRIAM
ncbi:hypothetical protein [Lewinella sp. 4G2]|uniref:hypothetical protein n=1 Tax=Lewinella sp. 4G2 TaxID=1803372 RepID=UPI0007E03BC3|nr:hypothetical protein [Lewinella sp. 4G2]OAV45128.1 hypothetical protein A3850_011785 [Lewinella sp. 4G2]